MAVAQTLKFQADRDTLFATLMDILYEFGYVIMDTDDAAKKVKFQAKAPDSASEEIVTASIVGIPDATASLLTLHVESAQTALPEEGSQSEIIISLFMKLSQHFPIVALVPISPSAAPSDFHLTPNVVLTCLVVVIMIAFAGYHVSCWIMNWEVSREASSRSSETQRPEIQRPEIHIWVMEAQMAMETPQHTTSGNSRFIYLTVGASNTTNQTQHVNPLYFTLSKSNGYTVNPYDDTYALPNYFQAMSLPPGGITQGVLIFLISADSSYVLHFDSGLTTPVDTNVSFSSG